MKLKVVRHRLANPPNRLPKACTAFFFCSSLTAGAGGTLSIAAIDTTRGEMGALAISCVGSEIELSKVIRLDPEVGAVIAQSYLYETARDEIFRQLGRGASPSEAVGAVLLPGFDPPGVNSGEGFRQYAALDLKGQVFAHTGTNSLPYAAHETGRDGSVVFSAQGNVLDGKEVLSAISSGFRESAGRVDQRLIAALLATVEHGGGDRRCDPYPADAGYFEVRLRELGRVDGSVVTPSQNAAEALLVEMRRQLQAPPDHEGEGAQDSARLTSSSGSGCSLGLSFGWRLAPLLTLAAIAAARIRRRTRQG